MADKYVVETFRQLCERVPQVRAFETMPVEDTLASILELADSMPGYELFQLHKPSFSKAVFVFRKSASDAQEGRRHG